MMVTKYANTVVWQEDQLYMDSRNAWKDIANASRNIPETYATGTYSKKGSTYKKPHRFYAHDFECDIPSNAVITKIQFQVRVKCDSKLKMSAPEATFMQFNQNVADKVASGKTGWHDGAFRGVISTKLSSNWQIITYTMSEKDIQYYSNPVGTVNSMTYGLMLSFPSLKQTGNVYISWVRMNVEYELPNPYITYNGMVVDENNPPVIPLNENSSIEVVFGNNSKADMESQTLNVRLPFGAELNGWATEYSDGSNPYYAFDSFNENNMQWAVTGKGHFKNRLTLNVIPRASGFKTLEIGNDTLGYYPLYLFVSSDGKTDFEGIEIIPSTLQRGEESCISIYASIRSNTSTHNLVCTIPQLQSNDIVSCALEDKYYSEDTNLSSYEFIGNNQVRMTLNVKPNTDTLAVIKLCFIPRVNGETTITCENASCTVDILSPIWKSIHFNSEGSECREIKIEANRIYSQVEGDLYIIPIGWEETDSTVYVDESTFTINQWKKRSYIGCVETPHSHHEPENDFKDQLLDEHYKNKHYLGKECTVDEDISLHIKLPKKKVPTVQGLITVDRPIPLNLIPDNWENDPLNHRGWAEIYGVKIKGATPLYYSCDIDVKYLTHNIISRFTIKHEGSANKFTLPKVLENMINSGDDLGEFFTVDTDGVYLYDNTEVNTHRNLFSYGNGQSVVMRSKSALASKSHIDMYWDTVKFSENRENNITRIVRLVDDTGRIIFEYEYYDFDFSDSIYSCRVMGRVATENGVNPIINKANVYLHSDVEYTEDSSDVEYDENAIDLYGSRTTFDLDSNKLSIKEYGFSGAEFTEEVELLTGNYYLVIEYKNNNSDADTSNVLTWFDFDIAELSETSTLTSYYDQLLVSPYPIPRKTIVFTRECDEGTIYYLKNDGGDFDFLLEPFYQYLCGVDLVAEESSIFDFNNSYPIVYVQNGLIRFGINRLNGDLYLDKWDYHSKQYIRTNRFRVNNFDDCEVDTINDDVIVVTVSDITITMWRGRPYVMLQHENEDIEILDNFSYIYADGINQEILSFPSYWNLSNSSNLLPECIGGTKLIKSDCIETETVESDLNDWGNFVIVADKDNCVIGEEVICHVPPQFSGKVYLVSDDRVLKSTSSAGYITTSFDSKGEKVVYAVYVGDENNNMELSNQITINVNEPDSTDDSGEFVLVFDGDSNFKYGQGHYKFGLFKNGSPISNKTIRIFAPTQTWDMLTGVDGYCSAVQDKSPAGKQTVTAVYTDNSVEIKRLPVTVNVTKSTPTIQIDNTTVKMGGYVRFRMVDENGNPLENVPLTVNIGGTKYIRTTSVKDISANTIGGKVSVKLSKKGTYTAKVIFAGIKNKYNSVSKSFTVEVI